MGSKNSDPPPAPDYTGAAVATANSNRTNQITPYGNLTYTPNASGNAADPWTATINLSPTGQRLLDQYNQTSLGLGALQSQGLDAVRASMANQPNPANLPARQINPGQTAQDAIMARQMPILNQQHDRLDNQLANQGIAIGSEAYKQAQDQFGRQVNDATSQAALQGIDVGQQARQQAIQEQNYYANQPLNQLNALRSGAQVTNPTFGQTAPGVNYSGAAANQYNAALNNYNAQTGNQNAMMGGLFSLAGSGLGSSFCDRRLKTNIKLITHRHDGLGVYSYTYKWGEPAIGVMADEVKTIYPHAVSTHASGYSVVDYSKLGA